MENPFPGLPLVESPIFLKILPYLDLSPEEKRIGMDLHVRGFAVFDFPDTQLHDRIERIKRNLAPRFDVDLESPSSEKVGGDRRIQDAWSFDDDVRALAANQTVLDILSKLYGRSAFPFQTLNFPVGTQQQAHSDSVHFSSLPERFMCGVWLAMEDIGPESGPLFYYPGSHRWPIMTNAIVGRSGDARDLQSAQTPFESAWRALVEASGIEEEIFCAKKGQALIWCANLLHGGSLQTNRSITRWSQVTHYYFDNCIYYTPAYSDEALGRLDVRQIFSIADNTAKPNKYLNRNLNECDNSRRGERKSFLARMFRS